MKEFRAKFYIQMLSDWGCNLECALFLYHPQTMDSDHSKSPEGLLGVLGHMLSGKSLDLLLAAAAATGKLKSFARKFIK